MEPQSAQDSTTEEVVSETPVVEATPEADAPVASEEVTE